MTTTETTTWTNAAGHEYTVPVYRPSTGKSVNDFAAGLGLIILSRAARVNRDDVKAIVKESGLEFPCVERPRFVVPELKGEERQVKRAKNVRSEVLNRVRQALADLLPTARAAAFTAVQARIARTTNAQWWIDNSSEKSWIALCK